MTYNSFQNIQALEITRNTQDAYSFHRYGEKAWFKCARFLIAEGYTLEAVIEVLRSKHMRWAADRTRTSLGSYIGFRKYYFNKQNPGFDNTTGKRYIDEMLKNECGLAKLMVNDEAIL